MPNPLIQPYLMFGGRCEEALEFYRSALGAQIEMLMRFQESPDPTPPGMLPPGFENKVMHASFRIGDNVLMASDGCEEGQQFKGFSLSIAVATEAEADRSFSALSDGGQIQMPLTKTFWSPRFGMLTDRFGISWMINVVANECNRLMDQQERSRCLSSTSTSYEAYKQQSGTGSEPK